MGPSLKMPSVKEMKSRRKELLTESKKPMCKKSRTNKVKSMRAASKSSKINPTQEVACKDREEAGLLQSDANKTESK